MIGGLLFWEKKKNLIKAVCVWLMLTIQEVDEVSNMPMHLEANLYRDEIKTMFFLNVYVIELK